ncbi:hypothetical protein HKX48_002942 [Thoreauomyces humboldtii]|nr:hypothetical protein HKX48_002942 [Thoreauomyces humboldtii]
MRRSFLLLPVLSYMHTASAQSAAVVAATPSATLMATPTSAPHLASTWLDEDALFFALVKPVAGDQDDGDDVDVIYPATDCYAQWCFPDGFFIDMVMSHCNTTITQLSDNNLPKTSADLESLLAECICGNQDAGEGSQLFTSITSMWKTCASCLNKSNGIQDPDHGSALMPGMFGKACACTDPGPVRALLNMQDPSWQCKVYDQSKLRTGRRGGAPGARQPTMSVASPAPAAASPVPVGGSPVSSAAVPAASPGAPVAASSPAPVAAAPLTPPVVSAPVPAAATLATVAAPGIAAPVLAANFAPARPANPNLRMSPNAFMPSADMAQPEAAGWTPPWRS